MPDPAQISRPVCSSDDLTGLSRPLLSVDCFEGGPARLAEETSAEHTMLIALQEQTVAGVLIRDGRRMQVCLRPGRVYLVPAGMPAGLSWEAPARIMRLRVVPARLDHFLASELRLLVNGSRLDGLLHIEDADLFRTARDIHGALSNTAPGQAHLFEALSLVFVIRVVRGYFVAEETGARPSGGLSPESYGALIDHIDANIGGNIRVPELARFLGMSESAFLKAVKSTTGMTPQELLRARRLEAAKALLRRPGMALGAIAAAAGFADQAHLSRSFKAAYGKSPRNWRAESAKF